MRAQKIEQFKSLDAKELALAIAGILGERQAEDITILDVSGPIVIADYFLIATARNLRHAHGLAREVGSRLKHGGRLRRNAAGIESKSSWVLLDYDEVVVHIFLAEARNFYALENLWADVPRLPFTPPAVNPAENPEETPVGPTPTPHVKQPRKPPGLPKPDSV